jgi:selenocysteine lyase/cysteine desulfurase
MVGNEGKLFSEELMEKVRSKFHHVDSDPLRPGRRIYFDNAGGAFRLKSALEAFYVMDSMPDCPERVHQTASYMNDVMHKAEDDIRTIFNAKKEGEIITMLTASQVIFSLTGTIAENVPGTNIVTTLLEHPCAFDAAKFFAEKTGKELRAARTNPVTGGVDVEELAKLIDQDTCLLSVIFASNISGAVLDIEGIVKAARAIKPDIYIIVDSVQHTPHGLIDVDSLGIDGVDFAPYKFYGIRGFGIGYASDRVSNLPHPRLLGKDLLTWSLGSPAPAHYAAISKVVDYVCWLGAMDIDSDDRRLLYEAGMNKIKLQERALMYRMLEGTPECPGLRHIPGVKVHLDYEDLSRRDFIMAISLDNWGHTEAVREYERRGIIVFERVNTNIYSKRMLESFGMEGCIRISPMHCNNIDEIDTFLKVTAEMVAGKKTPNC